MCLLQESKSETSLDMAQISHSHWPGRPSRFILIGRNVKQWRMSIDYIDVDEEVVSDVTPQPKSAKSKCPSHHCYLNAVIKIVHYKVPTSCTSLHPTNSYPFKAKV